MHIGGFDSAGDSKAESIPGEIGGGFGDKKFVSFSIKKVPIPGFDASSVLVAIGPGLCDLVVRQGVADEHFVDGFAGRRSCSGARWAFTVRSG